MSDVQGFPDDSAFRRAVGEVLESLLDQADDIDADLEPRLTPGNFQVTFDDDGSVFVLSQQTPTHELWLSANYTAWHFVHRGGSWWERDSGEPMLAVLNRLFTEKVGFTIAFELDR